MYSLCGIRFVLNMASKLAISFCLILICTAFGYSHLQIRRLNNDQQFKALQKQHLDLLEKAYGINDRLLPRLADFTNLLAEVNGVRAQKNSLITEADKLAILRSDMKAEADSKNSLVGFIGITGRSFFDGMTLGQFADEGIFTESKKLERWYIDISRRDASSAERYKQVYRDYQLILEQEVEMQGRLKTLIPTIQDYQAQLELLGIEENSLLRKMQPFNAGITKLNLVRWATVTILLFGAAPVGKRLFES